MPIVSGDLKFKYSTTSGTAGNTLAGAAASSLGRYVSTTVITGSVLNNLFDTVTGDENAAEDVEYRCIFIHNTHSTLTLQSAVLWLSAEVAGGTDVSVSVDTNVASDADASSAQAKTIGNESTEPSSQVWTAPVSKETGISIGSLAPDQVRAFWIRRTATDSSALNNDGVTFRVEGDTAA